MLDITKHFNQAHVRMRMLTSWQAGASHTFELYALKAVGRVSLMYFVAMAVSGFVSTFPRKVDACSVARLCISLSAAATLATFTSWVKLTGTLLRLAEGVAPRIRALGSPRQRSYSKV